MSYDSYMTTDPRGRHRDEAAYDQAETEADALYEAPCGICGAICADREPPELHGRPVCAECWYRSLGTE